VQLRSSAGMAHVRVLVLSPHPNVTTPSPPHPTPASSSRSVDTVSLSRILHRWPCRCLCRHRSEESLSGRILDVLGPVEAILAAARRGKVWSVLPLRILRRQSLMPAPTKLPSEVSPFGSCLLPRPGILRRPLHRLENLAWDSLPELVYTYMFSPFVSHNFRTNSY
jgi:hypothetical protein